MKLNIFQAAEGSLPVTTRAAPSKMRQAALSVSLAAIMGGGVFAPDTALAQNPDISPAQGPNYSRAATSPALATASAQSTPIELWNAICEQKMHLEGDIVGATEAAKRLGYTEVSTRRVPREITTTLARGNSTITLVRIVSQSRLQMNHTCQIDFGISQQETINTFTTYFQARDYRRSPPTEYSPFLWTKDNEERSNLIQLRPSENGTSYLRQTTRHF